MSLMVCHFQFYNYDCSLYFLLKIFQINEKRKEIKIKVRSINQFDTMELSDDQVGLPNCLFVFYHKYRVVSSWDKN